MTENAPKFKQISAEIEKKIRDGLYVSAQKLPSEYDLAKEYNCSRLTIRKAIDDLIRKNILVKRHGKGSYVMSQAKIQSGRAGLQGFTEAAKAYGKKSQTEVISFEEVVHPAEKIREALQVGKNESIYELIRRRMLDGEPMTVEKIYLPQAYVQGHTKQDFEGSLFCLIEKNVEIAYSHQEIEAILVEAEISELLNVPVGQPLLQVHSITYALDATPILYDVSLYRADRYTFKNTLTRYSPSENNQVELGGWRFLERMKIKEEIAAQKDLFYEDLNKIIAIRSVKGSPKKEAPFGEGPKRALEETLKLAERYGFQTEIVNDAVGYAQWGTAEEYLGIIGHLDVVPEGSGWSVPPFQLTKKNQRLYGRGILDNKGPILACLYGMKLLKELGYQPKKTIRLMFGTDEESGSGDIPLYLEKENAPVFGFTPDCKYPVVYGERGIVNYEITTTIPDDSSEQIGQIMGDQAKDHVPDQLSVVIAGKTTAITGKRAPSNAPELGKNAITLLAQKISEEQLVKGNLLQYFDWLTASFHEKHYGEGVALDFKDQDSGQLILTPYALEKRGQQLVLSLAVRYPVSITENEVTTQLTKALFPESEVTVIRRLPSTLFPKDERNVQKLTKVYEQITGLDGTPVTTTGATYARFMPNIVAFGPSFPGQKGIAHNQDEYMDEKDLLLNLEIYMQAMIALTEA
ncbi:GntR family transcriptional regulator [Enterococcus sp. DIV1434a]